MFPTLFSLGPIAVSSLGVFSLLAFLVGVFLVWRRGREEGLDEEALLDAAFISLVVGLVVGRVFFVLEHWPEFNGEAGLWLNFKQYGGFSFFGALLGAWVVLFFTSRAKKWDFWEVSDLAVFGGIWAQILVRIGQFLDGSFIGKATSLPIGIPFPGVEGSRFPAQLVEVGFLVLVYVWLRSLEKQYRLFVWYQDKRGETRPGFLTLTYGLVYGLFRFGLAFFRPASVYWLGLSFSQLISLGAAAIFLGLFGERMGKWDQLIKKWQEKHRYARPGQISAKVFEKPGSRCRRQPKKAHIKAGRDVKA